MSNTTSTEASTTAATTTVATTSTTTTVAPDVTPGGPSPAAMINPAVTAKSVNREAGAPYNPHLAPDAGGSVVLIVCCVVVLIVTIIAIIIYRRNWNNTMDEKRRKDELRKLSMQQTQAEIGHAAAAERARNDTSPRAATLEPSGNIQPVEMQSLQQPNNNRSGGGGGNNLEQDLLGEPMNNRPHSAASVSPAQGSQMKTVSSSSSWSPPPPSATPQGSAQIYKAPDTSVQQPVVMAAPQTVNPEAASDLLEHDDDL